MNERAIRQLLSRPIAYHRIFTQIGGSLTAGVMLSQAWYWREKGEDGWFWKTEREWEEETGLTRSEQQTARRLLRQRGFITEEKRGMPAKLFFRVEEAAIVEAVNSKINTDCRIPANKVAEIPQTEEPVAEILQPCLQESCNLVCRNPATLFAGILQTTKEHETTPETTPETTAEDNTEQPSAAAAIGPPEPEINPVEAVLSEYERVFENRFGEKPQIVKGKDRRLLGELVQRHGLEKVRRWLSQFIASNDDFIANAGWTIGVFYSRVNSFIAGRASRASPKRRLTDAELLERHERFVRSLQNG